MLSDLMKPGVKLLGLSVLINSSRPGFEGCYRVVGVGSSLVIEFFNAADRTDARDMRPVKILPYRPGMISEVAVGGGDVISGEFTGCVMSLFKRDGALTAAHVDTNPDTTQRAAWDTLCGKSGVEVVAEYDTTGKLHDYPGLDGSTVILCVGSGKAIQHFFVSKSAHQFSSFRAGPGGDPEKWRQHAETMYTVLPAMGH